jgi:hypothetical protein
LIAFVFVAFATKNNVTALGAAIVLKQKKSRKSVEEAESEECNMPKLVYL